MEVPPPEHHVSVETENVCVLLGGGFGGETKLLVTVREGRRETPRVPSLSPFIVPFPPPLPSPPLFSSPPYRVPVRM